LSFNERLIKVLKKFSLTNPFLVVPFEPSSKPILTLENNLPISKPTPKDMPYSFISSPLKLIPVSSYRIPNL